MTKRVRLLLLGLAATASLAFAGSALAAFTPKLVVSHTPPTADANGTAQIRFTVPRDDDALFRVVIYAPNGYRATLGQAVGSTIGTVAAQVQVQEPIAGAVLPITGNIVVADPASVATASLQCTQTPTHSAYWVLVLAAAGQELRVPMFVDLAAGAEATFSAAKLTACLPSPHIPAAAGGATFGAKLLEADLRVQSVFTSPGTGTHTWRAVATPWSPPATPNVGGTVEARAQISLPGRLTLTAASRKKVLTVRGSLTEAGDGIAGQRVNVRIGAKTLRATTSSSGAFRVSMKFKKAARVRVTATAAVAERTPAAQCSAASPLPVRCASETLWSFTATRTLLARVR
jgi:hypothetical protein